MMNRFLLLPLILVGCTAPVTDPPAHACSPRLDGEPTYCPPIDEVFLPRENIRGEIDIWNPHHFIHMQSMFMRNAKRNEIEKNMTQPEDAINKALMEFNNGDGN